MWKVEEKWKPGDQGISQSFVTHQAVNQKSRDWAFRCHFSPWHGKHRVSPWLMSDEGYQAHSLWNYSTCSPFHSFLLSSQAAVRHWRTLSREQWCDDWAFYQFGSFKITAHFLSSYNNIPDRMMILFSYCAADTVSLKNTFLHFRYLEYKLLQTTQQFVY